MLLLNKANEIISFLRFSPRFYVILRSGFSSKKISENWNSGKYQKSHIPGGVNWGESWTKKFLILSVSIKIWDFENALTLSVLEKLKNSIFEMPIIPQTLNINNLRTTCQSTCMSLESLSNTLLKNDLVKAMFILLRLSKYCYSQVEWYYHPPSGV